jgi:hypothetical protein
VQEELALMREEPCPPAQDAVEGGRGVQHRLVAGVSIFSFDLIPKFGKIMSEVGRSVACRPRRRAALPPRALA